MNSQKTMKCTEDSDWKCNVSNVGYEMRERERGRGGERERKSQTEIPFAPPVFLEDFPFLFTQK